MGIVYERIPPLLKKALYKKLIVCTRLWYKFQLILVEGSPLSSKESY